MVSGRDDSHGVPHGDPPRTDGVVTVRRAMPSEREALVSLAAAALGWRESEPNAELFAWKHDENPFGASPMWVAEVDGEPAGLRAFLRWRFDLPGGGKASAVRAVDTATHPDHQGRGLFTRLTLDAVEQMAGEGVDFVFNTPNDRSRPGYLKMGWQVVGRVPVAVRPAGPRGALRTARARVPAGKWSVPCRVGLSPSEAFEDEDGLLALLADQPSPSGLRTERSVAFYRWRYGLEALAYRVLLAGRSSADGFAVFRMRNRGPALEVVLCDVVVPGGDIRLAGRLARTVAARTRADYAIVVPRSPEPSLRRLTTMVAPGGFAVIPGQGPVLTWRHVSSSPEDLPGLSSWSLSLGDVELF